MFQDGVARDRPVRIETCGLLFLFLREKEEVEPTGDEHDRDADTDVRAEGRSFLAGDSAPVHQIAINVIEAEIGHIRHLFFSTEGGLIAERIIRREEVVIAPRDHQHARRMRFPSRIVN